MIARLVVEGSVKKRGKKKKEKRSVLDSGSTCVTNGIEHSVNQWCTAKRWGFRAFLNEFFFTVKF